MMIAPATFVVLFIMVAMAGSQFRYWIVASSAAYVSGVIISTELSKMWGWM